jgi:hypothetical protein
MTNLLPIIRLSLFLTEHNLNANLSLCRALVLSEFGSFFHAFQLYQRHTGDFKEMLDLIGQAGEEFVHAEA